MDTELLLAFAILTHIRLRDRRGKAQRRFGSRHTQQYPETIGPQERMSAVRYAQAIRKAIELHLKGLRVDGSPIPQPSSRVDYVEVAA